VQLNDYLLTNNLMPRYQSAYPKKHSTETALLRVLSDRFNAVDIRQVTLLDLSDLPQHSTASTTISCCSGWSMALVCRTLCCYRSIRSCRIEHSKWPMQANCRQVDLCCSAYHRTLFWALCCTFCTPPNSNRWSHGTACVYINTRMTAKFIFM